MSAEDAASVASRLCAACGMCCDGTLFQIVRMQPGDRPAELARLGLKIRSREGEFYMEQPCSALASDKSCCTVYAQRPTRCRLFRCQQLEKVEKGDSTEAKALGLIAVARELSAEVRGLMESCGLREDGQSLAERYARLMSTPVDAVLEPELIPLRDQLRASMERLRELLAHEFRCPPGTP